MPELPEVETVRRVLSDNLIGLKITDIESFFKILLEIYQNACNSNKVHELNPQIRHPAY